MKGLSHPRKLLQRALLIAALTLPAATTQAAEGATNTEITLMTEVLAPFQYMDGDKLVGSSVEIVELIQKRLKLHQPLKIFPWSRGIKILEKKPNTALFSMMRTPEREHLFKWVGPLQQARVVFFKKRGMPYAIHSLDDARQLRGIGVTKEAVAHQLLRRQGFTNLVVDPTGSYVNNMQKLIRKEIDLWAVIRKPGIYRAHLAGVADQIEPIDNLVIHTSAMYIAFSNKTDDRIIRRWQQTLDALKASGEIAAIQHKYAQQLK